MAVSAHRELPPDSGCLRTMVRRVLPTHFWPEVKELCVLAGPVFLSQILVFSISIVSSIFCGHLGKIELDSVTLAVAVINVTGVSVGSGLSSACDTLMSQSYGGRNLKRVGTVLQRGILILMLCCLPCWAIFINTEQVLLLCRQNPDVARIVGPVDPNFKTSSFIQSSTSLSVCTNWPKVPTSTPPSLYFKLHFKGVYTSVFYLLFQNIIWPQVITGLTVNIINAAVNAIFMYGLKLGVEGSAWANTLSQFAMTGVLFVYIIMKKLHVSTWGGWSTDCLQEWGLFMRLAIPSMLMVCIEWWSFEIGGFLAGWLHLCIWICSFFFIHTVAILYIGDVHSYSTGYSVLEQDVTGAAIVADSGFGNTEHLVLYEDSSLEAVNVVGDVISTKQLILRRGLTVFLALTVLLIGVTVRLFTGNG
ncbi:multidrug and toxin extrusion protein 2-like [Pyxicephalus adspersus]|uniref:multidrug and toxin extrusion protein 2-like n=1 Tax=Pyxicephalus adspersus TaxID=30357 RepID=UPI003B5A2CE4